MSKYSEHVRIKIFKKNSIITFESKHNRIGDSLKMILYLYGDLRYNINKKRADSSRPVKINIKKNDSIENVADVLKYLKINKDQLSHIFVNGKYCGYGKEISNNDRIGLFPKNMALNFAEIEKNNSISIQVTISDELAHNMDKSEFRINIPEGSDIRYLLKKLHFHDQILNLNIQLNKKSISSYEKILHNDDFIYIKGDL